MKSMIIQTKQETIKVMVEGVYFIISHPSKPHYVQIVTDKKRYNVFQKLQAIEKLYPNNFVRCHRNCLVNISKIKSVSLQERMISLGEEDNEKYQVIFSRRRHKHILEKWLKNEEK